MRINAYHHELFHMIDRMEVIVKTVDEENTFYGIRFYTEAPLLHHDDDDDSSAITIWGVAHRDERGHTAELRELFTKALTLCDEIDHKVANNFTPMPFMSGGVTPRCAVFQDNMQCALANAHNLSDQDHEFHPWLVHVMIPPTPEPDMPGWDAPETSRGPGA